MRFIRLSSEYTIPSAVQLHQFAILNDSTVSWIQVAGGLTLVRMLGNCVV